MSSPDSARRHILVAADLQAQNNAETFSITRIKIDLLNHYSVNVLEDIYTFLNKRTTSDASLVIVGQFPVLPKSTHIRDIQSTNPVEISLLRTEDPDSKNKVALKLAAHATLTDIYDIEHTVSVSATISKRNNKLVVNLDTEYDTDRMDASHIIKGHLQVEFCRNVLAAMVFEINSMATLQELRTLHYHLQYNDGSFESPTNPIIDATPTDFPLRPPRTPDLLTRLAYLRYGKTPIHWYINDGDDNPKALLYRSGNNIIPPDGTLPLNN